MADVSAFLCLRYATSNKLSVDDACRAFGSWCRGLREMAAEMFVRQALDELISPGRKIRIGDIGNSRWLCMAEKHATSLAHRLHMRVAIAEYSDARNRLRAGRLGLTPVQERPTTRDRVLVKSEIPSTWPQQYQPPRRVGMAQKSPGLT